MFSGLAAAIQVGLHRTALLTPEMASGSAKLAGTILLMAGVYQWLPIKNMCLTHCQSPLGFITRYWREGAVGRIQDGRASWPVLRRVLLGADDAPVRGRGDEPDLGGGHRRVRAGRKARASGAAVGARRGRAADRVGRICARCGRRSADAMVVAAFLLFVGSAAAQTGTAIVRVEVRSDGGAVAGASVLANGTTTIADRAGVAALTIAPGPLDLTVTRDGYLPSTIALTVAAGERRTVSVELQKLQEEVFVTAARSTTRLQDQPLRVEVVDEEEIEEKAMMTPGSVAMLLNETTGLRVQTTAPSLGAANVRIQGLRGRYSQLLADGLPLYGAQGDSLSLLQVPPLDLGQVEIIKGVASALYGASALGGVINLVSRRPRETESRLLVNATSQSGRDVAGFHARGAGGRLVLDAPRQLQRSNPPRSRWRRMVRSPDLQSRRPSPARVLRQPAGQHGVCDRSESLPRIAKAERCRGGPLRMAGRSGRRSTRAMSTADSSAAG